MAMSSTGTGRTYGAMDTTQPLTADKNTTQEAGASGGSEGAEAGGAGSGATSLSVRYVVPAEGEDSSSAALMVRSSEDVSQDEFLVALKNLCIRDVRQTQKQRQLESATQAGKFATVGQVKCQLSSCLRLNSSGAKAINPKVVSGICEALKDLHPAVVSLTLNQDVMALLDYKLPFTYRTSISVQDLGDPVTCEQTLALASEKKGGPDSRRWKRFYQSWENWIKSVEQLVKNVEKSTVLTDETSLYPYRPILSLQYPAGFTDPTCRGENDAWWCIQILGFCVQHLQDIVVMGLQARNELVSCMTRERLHFINQESTRCCVSNTEKTVSDGEFASVLLKATFYGFDTHKLIQEIRTMQNVNGVQVANNQKIQKWVDMAVGLIRECKGLSLDPTKELKIIDHNKST